MKVGILTYHNAFSYGAQLQAYALQEVVRDLGAEAFIIDYKGVGFSPPSWRDFRKSFLPWRFVGALNRVRIKYALQGFSKYQNRTRHLSDRAALNDAQFGFDAYICGSDQIWQPKGSGKDRLVRDEYFLGFSEPDARRIAYAPSFGTVPSDEYLDAVAPFVHKFTALSVREEKMVDLIRNHSGRVAETVCDPTILLGRKGFDSLIAKDGISKSRVGCSGLLYFPLSFDLPRDKALVTTLKRSMGPVTIVSCPLNMMTVGRNFCPTPTEWLFAIKNAKAVLTNSFHGTVFSILFNKPFVTLSWRDESKNERANNLLRNLGLSERYYGQQEDDIVELMNRPIDWASVNEKLSEWRASSRMFLKKGLGL